MKLLKSYLKAVKWYLPRGQRNDIINELQENLLSRMEETEARLGRPLTEVEQAAILREHGEPMVVAGRYGANLRYVAFGRQLIGPMLYPIYIWILWLHWGVTFLVHLYMAIFKESLGIGAFLIAALCQFIAVTAVFIVLDIYHRKALQFWCLHLEHIDPIPRWKSAFGLILWSVYSTYWALIPYFPALIFGNASGLRLAPAWHEFYWSILLLLLAGVAQRAINIVYPGWNWLQPSVRLVINIISLSMLYSLLNGYPYILVDSAATAMSEAARMASILNAVIKVTLLIGFSIYWSINVCFLVGLCIKHARYRWIHRRDHVEFTR